MTSSAPAEPQGRWRQLAILATALLLALVPWFSAASVAPLIAAEWRISTLEAALLTVAVQLGFVVGALVVAFSGAADVIPARRLIAGGALLAAVANAAFALFATDLVTGLPLRALSGAGIAAVYPVAMKVIAGWFRRGRGLAVGILTGAITLGTALPHLLQAGGTVAGLDWRMVVLAATLPCLAAAVIAWQGVREGPLTTPAARLSLRMARTALGERSVQLANLGYLGHMWELYALWAWAPAFLTASLAERGTAPGRGTIGLVVFVALGFCGALGCLLAGWLGDRFGRARAAAGAMLVSGTCCLLAAVTFGGPAYLLVPLLMVWGAAVIADSAMFSACLGTVVDQRYVGTALTLQTALGFLLTVVTIQLVPVVAEAVGWPVAVAMLGVGPLLGSIAMLRLTPLLARP
ncbi:MAG TPA: MFS transporter [Candidatus Limnocylindrales bacterium]|nr:MFS transporter [Candidatus Limnocylindrales bacterium]